MTAASAVQKVSDSDFSIEIPSEFYVLKRKAKGDLPDGSGNGRRGATVFTAGQMERASVVAVERFPVKSLLDEASISSKGDLSTFETIGISAGNFADLLNERREKERNSKAKAVVIEGTASFPAPGELRFRLRSDINVQKPDLLLEQQGVRELVRYTDAKALLVRGEMFVVYASALAQYDNVDGALLRQAVDSFEAR